MASRFPVRPGAFAVLLCCALNCATTAAGEIPVDRADAQDEPVTLLFKQAAFWESRHRGDLSRLVLRRVLESRPGDERALYELGISYSREGDIEEARNMHKRMLAANPESSYASLLGEHIKNSTFDQTRLGRARQLVVEGKFEDAIREYEYLFMGRDKVGPVALELMHTMSSIPERWPEAVDGLRQLLSFDPANNEIRFTLAQVLTYREESRREGLALLQDLSANPRYHDSALQKYREAVLWLHASPADEELLRFYADARPDDTKVVSRLQSLTRTVDPESYDGILVYGFEALRGNRLEQARKLFTQAAQMDKNKGDAWAGLAIVEQRRGLHAEAIRLFGEATRRDASLRARYRDAIDSAKFWNAINTVRSDTRRSQPEQALRMLDDIPPRTAQERLELDLTRAQVLQDAGRVSQAAVVLEGILATQPDSERAITGLMNLHLMTENYPGMSRLYARYAGKLNSASASRDLSVALLRARGLMAASRSQSAEAIAAYREGVGIAPDAVWLRLDYARLLLKLGRRDEAERVIAGMPPGGPESSSAGHARALFYMDLEDWPQVLSILDAMPNAASDSDLGRLRLIAGFRRDIAQAVAQGELRGAERAEPILIGLYEKGPRIKDRALLVVTALADFDLRKSATAIIRQAIRDEPDLGIDSKLAFAGYLIGWNEFSMSDRIVANLEGTDRLNAAQQLQLTALKIRALQARGSEAIENGSYAAARSHLDAAARLDARNPVTLRMLGQVCQLQGELTKSVAYYRQAIAIQPKDLWAIQGAVGSALEAGNLEVSRAVLDEALNHLPAEPEIYELIARVAQTAGETKMALEAMAYARSLR